MRTAWIDAAAPALGVLALTAGSALSASRQLFWTDEWLTHYLVTDRSFEHMLAASADLINAAPPLYFVLGWLWVHVFGASELALRLFTSLGFSCGFVALWWTLRRAWGAWPAATAALIAVFSCKELLLHNTQARFYGLYFAEITAAVAVLAAVARSERPTRGLLAATALVHASLVTTHYFGFAYSAALLLATLLVHARRPRSALLAAGAVVGGWLAFLPWIPAFLRHAQFGGGRFWVERPGLGALFGSFDLLQGPGFTALGLAAAAAVVEAARVGGAARVSPEPLPAFATAQRRRALALAALAFALVPLATWIGSQGDTSLFLHRYMFPTAISFAVLIASVAARVLARAHQGLDGASALARRILRVAPRAIFALVALVHVIVPLASFAARPQAPAAVDSLGAPSQLPLVMEDVHDFFVHVHYSRFPQSYVYVLDPEFALGSRGPGRVANAYQIMEALRRHYPLVRAVPLEDFLAHHERFFVFDSPEQRWFDERIRGAASFECRVPGNDPRWFLVIRKRDG